MKNKEPEKCKFLFEGFFNDRKTYNLCEAYWNRYIKSLVKDKIDQFRFFKNSYGNGLKIYDANPIVCVLFKNRGIRIILSPESEYEAENKTLPDYNLTAYWDTFHYNEEEYKELVLALFMRPSAIDKAKGILRKWLTSDGEEIELSGDPISPLDDCLEIRAVAATASKTTPLSDEDKVRIGRKKKGDGDKSIKRSHKKK